MILVIIVVIMMVVVVVGIAVLASSAAVGIAGTILVIVLAGILCLLTVNICFNSVFLQFSIDLFRFCPLPLDLNWLNISKHIKLINTSKFVVESFFLRLFLIFNLQLFSY